MPSAMTVSSSTINTFATRPTIVRAAVPSPCRSGDDLVNTYDDLRTGFTAAVSHELRTPLARILALLENATLPGADVNALVEQARSEVERAGELIDEILFLSELESGREIVVFTPTEARPILDEVVAELDAAAARAGVAIEVEGDATLPLRPRMIRVVAENLAA